MNEFLKETSSLNFQHPLIQKFVAENTNESSTETQIAVELFYAVRDKLLYNPYYINTNEEERMASSILKRNNGHCIDKSSLLIACYRTVGLPARIGLAKVKNHIATEKLEDYLGSNILTPHGYVEVLLNGSWWKVTPAFNKSLCEKLGVDTMDFNGSNHCLFQEYNQEGKTFMEYIEDYGTFEDIPWDFIIENMKKHYPKLQSLNANGIQVNLGEL